MVPYERVFSALNLLYTKTRNALTPECVNKLLYIQINRRTLRREGFHEKEEEEEEEEGKDDIITDTDDDAIFPSPSHTTEAQAGEGMPGEVSENELL